MQLDTGRTRQKNRTRRELVAATRRLLKNNQPITVDAVAAEADISRTTAYRYFPDAETLLLEAMLEEQAASPEEIAGDCTDVRERVHRVQRHLLGLVRASEPAYRMYLSRALANSVQDTAKSEGKARQVRGGRRLAMYEHALLPARDRLGEDDLQLLVLSLSAASGVESFVALKDACRLEDGLADRVASSIIDAILDRHLG